MDSVPGGRKPAPSPALPAIQEETVDHSPRYCRREPENNIITGNIHLSCRKFDHGGAGERSTRRAKAASGALTRTRLQNSASAFRSRVADTQTHNPTLSLLLPQEPYPRRKRPVRESAIRQELRGIDVVVHGSRIVPPINIDKPAAKSRRLIGPPGTWKRFAEYNPTRILIGAKA